MAVQQNKVTPSRRGMRRSHDALTVATTSVPMATIVVARLSTLRATSKYVVWRRGCFTPVVISRQPAPSVSPSSADSWPVGYASPLFRSGYRCKNPDSMSENVTIALDAMGGDVGPAVVVPAALQVLAKTSHLTIVLVGDKTVLEQELASHNASTGPNLRLQHASQKVEMDDKPSLALRGKKDSSMRVAINLVKSGEAQACVSAGNTGALMATARFVLKMLPGIDRPAICSALPAINGPTHMLDLGANVDTSAENLLEFAVMGSVLTSAVENLASPTVGLLNIGEEEVKGNERVKEAARLLTDSSLNYIGFVEGDDIYKGSVDVVVCDGFVGNVALKTSEGVAKMISNAMKEEFSRNLLTRLAALMALPVLKALRRRIDPRRYNGASLLGLQGIVVKSHGGADVLAFTYAIREAVKEVEKNVPQRISKHLEALLSERQTA